jgi:hypothetical protein
LRRSSAIKKFGTPVSEFAAAGGDADAVRSRGNTVEFLRLELFAIDSPLEGAVSSELVSALKFPVSRENTGNFIRSGLGGAATR